MNTQQIAEKLKNEVNGENRSDVVDDLEGILSKNVEELTKNKFFFHLPLKNIFSIISKSHSNSIDENGDGFENLLNIIRGTINAHHNEKETLLILQNIDISQYSLLYERISSILELHTICPIFRQFSHLYKEKLQPPEKNYEFELHQKEKTIERLKLQKKDLESQTKMKFKPIKKKPKNFEPDIFIACKEGKFTSVQWLIEKENIDKNKRVEETDYNNGLYEGEAPIHIASKNGHLLIVQYLIDQQNVNIDIKGGYYEQTPLHYACEKGHLPIAEYLISKGANINAKDVFGDYVIHSASKGSHLPIVQYLIEKQNVDIDIKGPLHKTPLIYACEFDNRIFIQEKSDGTKKGWNKIAQLYYELEKDHIQIVDYLISKGANVNAKDCEGNYVIHTAILHGHLSIVQYLIEKQNVSKDKKGRHQMTTLHYACKIGHLPIVQYLISHGAIFWINAKDAKERTSLHYASYKGYTNIVKYLVSNGANKNSIDKYGKTPYDCAQNDEIKNILK